MPPGRERVVRIGCSGWNYANWKAPFYDGRRAREWLELYARSFDTVEINNTFYRLPRRDSVAAWERTAPEGFLFAVKVSRYITHIKRLRDLGEPVARFRDCIEPLRKRGPFLWQLPPSFPRDDERLRAAARPARELQRVGAARPRRCALLQQRLGGVRSPERAAPEESARGLGTVFGGRYRPSMAEGIERVEKVVVEDLEKGLHLHHHLGPRRERAMFATLGFFVALAITRGITTWLHYHGAGANGGIIVDGVHVHHEAFGIIGLVLLGYAWLLLYGFEPVPRRRWFRITGVVYGICTALILDEFALWLNLRDVYWQKQGRESIEAIAIFAGFLLWAVLIAPFARAVWRHLRAAK